MLNSIMQVPDMMPGALSALPMRYLVALGKLGRPAGLVLWRTQCLWRQRQENFYSQVIQVLIERNLVYVSNSVRYAVTPAGREVLGLPLVNRQAVTMAPLRPRPVMLMRDGAMDYASIPSRMGGQQVPFKSALANAGLAGGPASMPVTIVRAQKGVPT